MSDPAQKATPKPVNWPLVANEVKIYRDYACHDGQPGFSLKDARQLETSNPDLYQETLKHYQNSGRLPHFPPYRKAPYLFFGYFGDNSGGSESYKAVSRALVDILKINPATDMRGAFGFRWAKGDASQGTDVAPYYGERGDVLKRSISQEALDYLKTSLLEYFTNQGVSLQNDELSVGVHRFTQKGYPYRLKIEFFPALKCQADSPGV